MITEIFWQHMRNVLLNPTSGQSFYPESNHDKGALITLSAQGVGTVNGTDQANTNGRGAHVCINISAISGTIPTLTVKIQGKDTVSGQYYDLLTSTALAATGFTFLTLCPGAATTANLSIPQLLPATWRVIATVAGTTPSVTATVGASVVV